MVKDVVTITASKTLLDRMVGRWVSLYYDSQNRIRNSVSIILILHVEKQKYYILGERALCWGKPDISLKKKWALFGEL